MNISKLTKQIITRTIFLFFAIFSLNIYSQETEYNIIGNWISSDFWSNESKTTFSKDGYISMTINGEQIDGRNFIIHGGPNDGQKAEMKYLINTKTNPIQIDIIALKDNVEKGRILGIIIPVHHTRFLMLLNFEGKRPETMNDENYEQTLTLNKIE
ncbi:hypothetical protein EIZ47_09495 [Chryseobacterium lacus]|uniref:Uncharacterized protein n=1 Tax=Chryseobacterium lacus TaxID=2058346 RepID=A0A368MVG1_9FLAO|nr:hypothetical protein [Chryseobacterium lacus]RCU42182.1 hypothetical protein DQ356_09590 [Chryseobacterium lacus]RST26476.1 hypothetical protein EIZ47_09495 [Chryseobacterium lacus]